MPSIYLGTRWQIIAFILVPFRKLGLSKSYPGDPESGNVCPPALPKRGFPPNSGAHSLTAH